MPCALSDGITFVIAQYRATNSGGFLMKINWFKIGQTAKALLKKLWDRIVAEPVVVRTVLALAVSAGYLELSDKQLNTINAAVVGAVLIFGAVSARGAVKPLPKSKRQGVLGQVKGIRNGGRK